jgi:trk system potassium uptake protein TrkH
MLPISSKSGKFTDSITALFTVTSATCVTGLVVVDTGTYWSNFGQLVVMCLIQIGGLSYIVLATSLMILLNRKIPLRERIMIQFSLNTISIRGIVGFLKGVLLAVILFHFH